MPNRSIRDEKQRAGAPGRGSLFGKKTGAAKVVSNDPATRDLSIKGAAKKLINRKARIDQAIEDAS